MKFRSSKIPNKTKTKLNRCLACLITASLRRLCLQRNICKNETSLGRDDGRNANRGPNYGDLQESRLEMSSGGATRETGGRVFPVHSSINL